MTTRLVVQYGIIIFVFLFMLLIMFKKGKLTNITPRIQENIKLWVVPVSWLLLFTGIPVFKWVIEGKFPSDTFNLMMIGVGLFIISLLIIFLSRLEGIKRILVTIGLIIMLGVTVYSIFILVTVQSDKLYDYLKTFIFVSIIGIFTASLISWITQRCALKKAFLNSIPIGIMFGLLIFISAILNLLEKKFFVPVFLLVSMMIYLIYSFLTDKEDI